MAARWISGGICQLLNLQSGIAPLKISFGVRQIDPALSAEDIQADADTAMYASKRAWVSRRVESRLAACAHANSSKDTPQG